MDPRKQIEQELKELGVDWAQQPHSQPYAVPSGFFENFPELMLGRIKLINNSEAAEELSTLSPLLAGISRKMPFEVPKGYFDQLQQVAHPEAFINSLPRTMPFEVPPSYFETLPQMILSRLPKAPAKVVPMYRRPWMKMVAAAMVAGLLTFSGIRYFNSSKEISVDNPQWVAAKLKNVPDKALDDFVKTASVLPVTAKATTAKSDNSNLLKDVSDKELEAFLDQVPVEEELGIN